MIVTLFEFTKYSLYCQINFSFLSITIGENERSLFSMWKDGYKYQFDILFFHVLKIGYNG